MLTKIAQAIEAELVGTEKFRSVEQSISAGMLKSPPSVAFFLANDKLVTDSPMVTRELSWDLVLMTPALGVDKGLANAGECIDIVRRTFSGWLAFTTGGVLPATVPEIRLEGIEQTLLVYTVRLTMKVMPDIIDS